jgi:hypothetical protein
MFHGFYPRLPGTGRTTGFAQESVRLRDCRPFEGRMREGFGSRKRNDQLKQHHEMGKRTSVERPPKTMLSISAVMRERASSIKASCEDATLMERRGIGTESGNLGLFSLSTSGPLRRLPTTAI